MSAERAAALAGKIRDIPDFPKQGILFKDITTLLKDGAAFKESLDLLAERCAGYEIDKVIGIESRGFIFGAPLADRLGAGFVLVRKLGRLPGETVSAEYALEYGTNTVEMHADSIERGERVLIVDDLLATGGTCRAAIELVGQVGGTVVACAFLIELAFLEGRKALGGCAVEAVMTF